SRFDFDLLALRDPGSLGDNTKPNVNVSYIVEQWNKNWEYPKLRVSIYSEYFKRFEEKYGTYLKTFKGAWPDYWISNSGSAAFETGVNRITHNNKIIAERICTLLKILNSDFKYPGKKIEDIYNKIIIEDRSGWANDVSVLEPDNYKTKGEIAENFSNVYRAAISAGEIIKEVHQDLVDNAANGVDFKQKRYPDRTHNIVVTNILNWKRSDIAEVLIPKRLLGESKKIRIFDPINDKELRSQIKIICPEDNYRERITDFEKVVFFAEDVPAFGLKNFEVIFDDKGSGGNSFGISDNAIENQFYTVRFDPRTGMIENLEDKDSGRDLINHSSKYQFNQLIYENPEEKRDLSWTNPLVKEGKVTISEDIIYLNPIFKEEFGQSYSYPGRDSKIKRISPENQEIIGIRNGEIFSELFTRSSIDCLFPDIISHFILDNCSKRIFLRNFISKVEKMDAEAVYFAFPFNIEKPVFKLNCHNGYFEPEKQQLPGSNRNWYCSQKWVDIYNKETALTWSSIEAPLVEIGDINTSKWLDKLEIDRADLFSYIMNNYWFTAAAAGQGGRNWFNYCFTTKSSTFDPVSSYRFGHSFHYPIIAEFLEDPGKNSGNQLAGLGEYGFIGDIPENIIINGFKKSEKDNSIIIRFLEVKGLSTKFKFNFKVKKIIGAYETTPVEDEIKKAKIENGQIMISIDPYELKTYKLVF
ncbi:MAG TPA: hypothetical protein DCP02_06855, partial [Actinobacteria bacterium]|nr:hypothetical protein [Actinomycetota bacterium]